MKLDISYITMPEDFNDMTDFFLPEKAPMNGVTYPNAVSLQLRGDYQDIVSKMVEEASKSQTLEFSLELISEGGNKIIFRGHSINSVEGKVFIFRRLPSIIPDIKDIGMPKGVISLLTDKMLNSGGLILIAGETGQGKSTTAAATIAHRLAHFGSFCLTIENPVEFPLQGLYGDDESGVCFQTEVKDDEILDAIKSSLRCYPSVSNSILFLGEVRDGKMASEVLKIAANGHLVITTMHGSDLLPSLKRFISLAAENSNHIDEVKSMFASVFRLLIHQRMVKEPNGRRRLKPRVLYSPDNASPIANRLRSSNLDALASEIDSQNNMIAKNQSIR